MKSRTPTFLVAACATASALWAGTALAGYKIDQQVLVQKTSRYAFGSLASARQSSDNQQWIGCYSTPDGYGYCYATDQNGNSSICYTNDAAKVAVIRSVNAGSRLYFTWNANDSCTWIDVGNFSFDGTK